jgi:hypothetical protein
MRRLGLLCLLLLLAVPAHAIVTIRRFTGFETGGANEIVSLGASSSIVQSTVLTGSFSLKQAAAVSVIADSTTHAGAGITAIRFSFKMPVALPGADTTILIYGNGVTTQVPLQVTSGGFLKIINGNGCTTPTTTATGTAMVVGQKYIIRSSFDTALNGVIKAWIDDALEINVQHTTVCTNTVTNQISVGGVASPNEYFIDDFVYDNRTLNTDPFPVKGIVLARQAWNTGVPLATDSGWTMTGGTCCCAVQAPFFNPIRMWDASPVDLTCFMNDNGAGTSETMQVKPFTESVRDRGDRVTEENMAPTTTFTNGNIFGGTGVSSETSQAIGQSFTAANSYSFEVIEVALFPSGGPTDRINLEVLTGSMTGTVIAFSDGVDASGSIGGLWTTFYFQTATALTSGTKYFLRITRTGARDITLSWTANTLSTASSYAGGGAFHRDNNTWSGESTTEDLQFRVLENGVDFATLSDTVNSCKHGAIAKRSAGAGSTHNIRRRVNAGAPIDSNVTLLATDSYVESPTPGFTDTVANLNLMEIGGNRVGGARIMTIEDTWMFCDITPNLISPAIPQSRPVRRYRQGFLPPFLRWLITPSEAIADVLNETGGM